VVGVVLELGKTQSEQSVLYKNPMQNAVQLHYGYMSNQKPYRFDRLVYLATIWTHTCKELRKISSPHTYSQINVLAF
jgi:hypothetical protein